MAAKKKTTKSPPPKGPATPKGPTTAQAYYIESHWGKKEPAAIAADVQLPVAQVEAYLARLAESGARPAAPPPPAEPKSGPERAGFATRNGVTSMTQTASEMADESSGNSPFSNAERKAAMQEQQRQDAEKFAKVRLRGAVHVIDPSRPVT